MSQIAKDGASTEFEVLSLIRTAPQPVQTWEIQKRLKYTSGKLQSALRRLEGNHKIVRKKVTRVTEEAQAPRVVSLVWDRDFEAQDQVPTKIIEKEIPVPGPAGEQLLGFDLVHFFEALKPVENPENPDEVAIPIKLSKFEAQLLSALPEVNPEFNNVVDFIQQAVTKLLAKQKNDVKQKAIQFLINQGTISEEYGKQLLGLKDDQDVDGGEPDE